MCKEDGVWREEGDVAVAYVQLLVVTMALH